MNNHQCNITDILSLFEDSLSPADVLSAKLMAQISATITSERIRLKMNQSEFAAYINASQSLVSRWEHGDYNFSIRKLAEIAEKLNMNINISMLHYNVCKFSNNTGIYSKPISMHSERYAARPDTTIRQNAYKPDSYKQIIEFKKQGGTAKCSNM